MGPRSLSKASSAVHGSHGRLLCTLGSDHKNGVVHTLWAIGPVCTCSWCIWELSAQPCLISDPWISTPMHMQSEYANLGGSHPQKGPSQACEALSPEDSGLHALTIDCELTKGYHSPGVGKIKPVPQLTTIRSQAYNWYTLQCHVARRMGVQPHR